MSAHRRCGRIEPLFATTVARATTNRPHHHPEESHHGHCRRSTPSPTSKYVVAIPGAPTHVRTGEVLGSGRVVLFAVPGAFTPTCSDYHLPSYLIRNDDLRAKGVDTVACISVNDPFVMEAWGKDEQVGDAVTLLADGNGAFTAAVGLEMDGSGFGLGTRSQRLRHGHRGRRGDRPPCGAGRAPHRQCRRRHPRGAVGGG